MQLTNRQRAFVRTLFDAFNSQEIPYVVLRGHSDLPDRMQGSDIDVFVEADSFDSAVQVCEKLGLDSKDSRPGDVIGLVSEGIQQPFDAITLLVTEPDDFVSHVQRRLFGANQNGHAIVERSFEGATRVHLLNHHAYTSPLSGEKIRVDPRVEEAMLDRRVERNSLYVPAAPDELTHLVCRGVFDYEGTFPTYYRERCDQLLEEVLADDTRRTQFQSLLELVFFKAHGLVFDHVVAGTYDDIRGELARFAGY